MKRRIYTLVLMAAGVNAAPLNVCDFEEYEIGTAWTLWQAASNRKYADTH